MLEAVNPVHAVRFFVEHDWHGFLVLGAVVLVITGGEALYADMGHFGRRPIRLAWYVVVLPALLLNYFGQGALLLEDPAAATNPFYAMVPGSLIYPMVALSTMATIIASQALISGAFSLTQQAVQLGFFPRVTIVHTSGEAEGQIYIPEINAALVVACIWLVLTFQESSALAAAYGIAVTGTMTITSIIYYVVLTRDLALAAAGEPLPLVGAFLMFDLAFFGANLLSSSTAAGSRSAMAAVIFLVMTTWKKGRAMLARNLADQAAAHRHVPRRPCARLKPPRVPGTAVFMSSNPNGVPDRAAPPFQAQPGAARAGRAALGHLRERARGAGRRSACTSRTSARASSRSRRYYGFMQTPNVPDVMQRAAAELQVPYAPATTSYYLGRETLLATKKSGMQHLAQGALRVHLAQLPLRHAYFGIPPDRVVELGMQK